MTETKDNSFDDFLGDFLKPDMVKDLSKPYACVGWDTTLYKPGTSEEKRQLIYELSQDSKVKKWVCNTTNVKLILSKDIKTIDELVGKLVFFDKMKVNNPATGLPQDGLIIDKIEDVK